MKRTGIIKDDFKENGFFGSYVNWGDVVDPMTNEEKQEFDCWMNDWKEWVKLYRGGQMKWK